MELTSGKITLQIEKSYSVAILFSFKKKKRKNKEKKPEKVNRSRKKVFFETTLEKKFNYVIYFLNTIFFFRKKNGEDSYATLWNGFSWEHCSR